MTDWGRNVINSTSTTIANARAMGGDIGAIGTNKLLKSISFYVGGSGTGRLALYQGGDATDPGGATLVHDFGTFSPSGNNWVTLVIDDNWPTLTQNVFTWCAWKGDDSTVTLFYETTHALGGGDFQVANGRWASGLMSGDETVAFEGTWDDPDTGGAYGAFWYSIYLTYEIIGIGLVSTLDFDDAETSIVVGGGGFEATQATGKIELSDNATYATGTKVAQTVTSWADGSITMTADIGSLAPGGLWLWVTNDNGDLSASKVVTVHRAKAFAMSASANITASGENTTRQMTTPATKAVGDFDGGRIQDDENPGDTIDVTSDGWREDEWCMEALPASVDGETYEFRVLIGGVAADTITVTPGLTISADPNHIALPGVETLALSGDAPTAFREDTITPAVKALLLDEKLPFRVTNHVTLPAVRALVLAGQAPSVEENHFTDVAVAPLVLAGQTPTAFLEHIRAPPVRELDLTGKVPTTLVDGPSTFTIPYVELRLISLKGLQLFGHAPIALDSGDADVTAEPGAETLALSGKAPTLFRETFRTPAIDTLVLAGQAPSVERDYFIDVAEGTLVFAGQAPSAVRADSITPAIDDLVLAGQAPSVEENHFIAVAPDTLLLVGKAPTVMSADARAPGEELLVLAGQAPTVERDYFIDIAAGALVLAGKLPDVLSADAIAPGAGSLVLSGDAPTVERDFFIDITDGTFVLDGKVPTLFHEAFATPAIDDLVLAGQAPTVERDYFIDIAAGSLSLAGKVPDLLAAGNIVPGTESLVLAGIAPTVLTTLSASPAAETLALSGTTPSLNWSIDAPVGALVLSGDAPSVERDFFIDVAAGSLTLAGQAPSIVAAGAIVPPAGELRLTVFRGLQLFGHGPTIEVSTSGTAVPAIGTLVLAGQAPVVITPQSEEPGAGSLALTGAAPTVSVLAGDAVSPAAAELRLTVFRGLQLFGYPPVAFVTTDHEAFPPAGALTLTTHAIITDPVLQPAAATLNIFGYSFTANTQPVITIVVPEATLVMTGYAPERGRGLLLTGYEPNVALSTPVVNPDLLVLSGKTPNIVDTTPQPHVVPVPERRLGITPENVTAGIQRPTDESSLILEGWAPISTASSPVFFPPIAPLVLTPHVIDTDHNIAPPAGTLALTGPAPTVSESDNHYVDPLVGSLTLAGQNVTLFADTQLFQPAAAALTLAGQDVRRGDSISPEAVQRNFNGKTPVVVIGVSRVIEPAIETLSLSGAAPFALIGPVAVADVAELALAGQAPTIVHTTGHLILPAAATLILAPHAPAFRNTLSVLPPAGALLLQPHDVTWTLRQMQLSGANTKLIQQTVKRRVESINR